MKQRIQITVEVPDGNDVGNFKVIFRLENLIDDCVEFDFKAVYRGLRCLYPEPSAVISFKMMP